MKFYHSIVCLFVMMDLSFGADRDDFVTYKNCQLVNQFWNDGDSFQVKLPNGKMMVCRLYGIDCLETSSKEIYMKRRLDTQGYYFGIYGKGSIDKRHGRLKELGKEATSVMQIFLQKPFTVITKKRDAKGKKETRSYAYVRTTNGADLGKMLVRSGLARVYGFIDDLSGVDEGAYRLELYDQQMIALGKKNGCWRHTEWRDFDKERSEYRKLTGKININRVERTVAMITLIAERSGVEESVVKVLLEKRGKKGYKNKKALTKIKGIGEKKAELLMKVLKFK